MMNNRCRTFYVNFLLAACIIGVLGGPLRHPSQSKYIWENESGSDDGDELLKDVGEGKNENSIRQRLEYSYPIPERARDGAFKGAEHFRYTPTFEENSLKERAENNEDKEADVYDRRSQYENGRVEEMQENKFRETKNSRNKVVGQGIGRRFENSLKERVQRSEDQEAYVYDWRGQYENAGVEEKQENILRETENSRDNDVDQGIGRRFKNSLKERAECIEDQKADVDDRRSQYENGGVEEKQENILRETENIREKVVDQGIGRRFENSLKERAESGEDQEADVYDRRSQYKNEGVEEKQKNILRETENSREKVVDQGIGRRFENSADEKVNNHTVKVYQHIIIIEPVNTANSKFIDRKVGYGADNGPVNSKRRVIWGSAGPQYHYRLGDDVENRSDGKYTTGSYQKSGVSANRRSSNHKSKVLDDKTFSEFKNGRSGSTRNNADDALESNKEEGNKNNVINKKVISREIKDIWDSQSRSDRGANVEDSRSSEYNNGRDVRSKDGFGSRLKDSVGDEFRNGTSVKDLNAEGSENFRARNYGGNGIEYNREFVSDLWQEVRYGADSDSSMGRSGSVNTDSSGKKTLVTYADSVFGNGNGRGEKYINIEKSRDREAEYDDISIKNEASRDIEVENEQNSDTGNYRDAVLKYDIGSGLRHHDKDVERTVKDDTCSDKDESLEINIENRSQKDEHLSTEDFPRFRSVASKDVRQIENWDSRSKNWEEVINETGSPFKNKRTRGREENESEIKNLKGMNSTRGTYINSESKSIIDTHDSGRVREVENDKFDVGRGEERENYDVSGSESHEVRAVRYGSESRLGNSNGIAVNNFASSGSKSDKLEEVVNSVRCESKSGSVENNIDSSKSVQSGTHPGSGRNDDVKEVEDSNSSRSRRDRDGHFGDGYHGESMNSKDIAVKHHARSRLENDIDEIGMKRNNGVASINDNDLVQDSRGIQLDQLDRELEQKALSKIQHNKHIQDSNIKGSAIKKYRKSREVKLNKDRESESRDAGVSRVNNNIASVSINNSSGKVRENDISKSGFRSQTGYKLDNIHSGPNKENMYSETRSGKSKKETDGTSSALRDKRNAGAADHGTNRVRDKHLNSVNIKEIKLRENDIGISENSRDSTISGHSSNTPEINWAEVVRESADNVSGYDKYIDVKDNTDNKTNIGNDKGTSDTTERKSRSKKGVAEEKNIDSESRNFRAEGMNKSSNSKPKTDKGEVIEDNTYIGSKSSIAVGNGTSRNSETSLVKDNSQNVINREEINGRERGTIHNRNKGIQGKAEKVPRTVDSQTVKSSNDSVKDTTTNIGLVTSEVGMKERVVENTFSNNTGRELRTESTESKNGIGHENKKITGADEDSSGAVRRPKVKDVHSRDVVNDKVVDSEHGASRLERDSGKDNVDKLSASSQGKRVGKGTRKELDDGGRSGVVNGSIYRSREDRHKIVKDIADRRGVGVTDNAANVNSRGGGVEDSVDHESLSEKEANRGKANDKSVEYNSESAPGRQINVMSSESENKRSVELEKQRTSSNSKNHVNEEAKPGASSALEDNRSVSVIEHIDSKSASGEIGRVKHSAGSKKDNSVPNDVRNQFIEDNEFTNGKDEKSAGSKYKNEKDKDVECSIASQSRSRKDEVITESVNRGQKKDTGRLLEYSDETATINDKGEKVKNGTDSGSKNYREDSSISKSGSKKDNTVPNDVRNKFIEDSKFTNGKDEKSAGSKYTNEKDKDVEYSIGSQSRSRKDEVITDSVYRGQKKDTGKLLEYSDETATIKDMGEKVKNGTDSGSKNHREDSSISKSGRGKIVTSSIGSGSEYSKKVIGEQNVRRQKEKAESTQGDSRYESEGKIGNGVGIGSENIREAAVGEGTDNERQSSSEEEERNGVDRKSKNRSSAGVDENRRSSKSENDVDKERKGKSSSASKGGRRVAVIEYADSEVA